MGHARATPPRCVDAATLEPLEPRLLLADSAWVYPSANQTHLLYKPLPTGDRIIDFSRVGYRDGLAPIPDVPTILTVRPGKGDDRARIQAAIDAVSAMPKDPKTGFRGAVQLAAGAYEIDGSLTITASGVVLRGAGDGGKGTRLLATAADRRPLIDVNYEGRLDVPKRTASRSVTEKYVPAGSRSFHLDRVHGLAVGDRIIVHRPSQRNWIKLLGMHLLEYPWQPGAHRVDVERTITRIEGNKITIDDPLTHSLDQRYGGGLVYDGPLVRRIRNVGIESIRGDSVYASPDDIDHAWSLVRFHATEHGWVRRVTAEHFVQGAVTVKFGGRSITVERSVSRDPVSPILGGLRYAFYVDDGEKVLVRNVLSIGGRHDFVAGSRTHGPNVWVDAVARDSFNDTGPHEDYSTGLLWDNIVTDDELNVRNRGNKGTNHGWTGANNVVWNSQADRGFQVRNPPGSQNWLIGGIGAVNDRWTPDSLVPLPNDPGIYDAVGSMVSTRSLYYAQMKARQQWPDVEDREYRVGDIDGYVNDGKADVPYVHAGWAKEAGGMLGRLGPFDDAEGTAPVAFSIEFDLSPGERVVGASLSVGLRRTSDGSSGDGRVEIAGMSRGWSFEELSWGDMGTTPAARVIDLNGSLDQLQAGVLHVAIGGGIAVDWAMLDIQVVRGHKPGEDLIYQDGFGRHLPVFADRLISAGDDGGDVGDDDETDVLGRLNKLALF